MKKVAIIYSIIILLIFGTIVAYAGTNNLNLEQADFQFTLNGTDVQFELPVVTINDRTYLPLRELCGKLGITINWIGDDNKIEMITKTDETSNGETHHELKDFSFLKEGMSLEEIYDIVGEPSYYTGSGIMWGVYTLDEGMRLHLHDYMSGYLKAVSLQTKDNTSVFIAFNEDGTIKMN